MLVGYARVSTTEQNLDLQRDALEKAECGRIFPHTVSGAKDDRPGLTEALSFVREGETLGVWKLGRIGRTMLDMDSVKRRARQQWEQSGRA